MKVNLKSDAKKVRKYIKQRIKDFPIYENLGPGEDDNPIALITVGFYATQGGYMNLVFDTRSHAEVDGEWTIHINNDINMLRFPKWVDACEAIWEGKAVSVTKHDGSSCTFKKAEDADEFNRVIGEMLTKVVTDLRADGALAKLPLAPKAYLVVEEFDGDYLWPTDDTRKTGRIQ